MVYFKRFTNNDAIIASHSSLLGMKTMLLLSFLSFLSVCTAQQWLPKSDFSGSARDDGAVFTIGSRSFCGTGRDAGFAVTGDFYAFDASTELWSTISSLPDSARRQYAMAASHNSFGYLFGGIDAQGNYLNDFWKYDPSADMWENKGIAPFEGRSGGQCFVIADTLYIAGGKTNNSAATSELWAFDCVNEQWFQRSNLPNNGIWKGFGVANDTMAIVGLGTDESNMKRGEVYFYQASIDSWSEVVALNALPRNYPSASILDSRILIYGGVDALGVYSNAFEYIDLQDSTWNDLNAFPNDARKGCMVFSSGSDFYLTTGISETARLRETWGAKNVLGSPSLDYYSEILCCQNGGYLEMDASIVLVHFCALDGAEIQLNAVQQGVYLLPQHLQSGIYLCVLERGGRLFRQKVMVTAF